MKYNVAILGATGLVGETMLDILEQREFPVDKLYALASHRSAGKTVMFQGRQLEVIDVEEFDFSKVHLALFSAGGATSKKYVPIATQAGCVVIDNTSSFRYDNDVPLVVTEVNPKDIELYKKKNIIANPNCSTMQMLVALKPIYDAVGISRINVATYQAVSGSGRAAVSELIQQLGGLLNGRPADNKVYPCQIAFNAIPHIDEFQDNGYTKEEMKLVSETQKILGKNIQVNATAVRIPVLYGHSEAVHLETEKEITVKEVINLLEQAPGIVVMDNIKELSYPTPFHQAIGNDEVYVGRIRKDISHPKGINLWIVSDNVRKGAALNSVQIAELLVKEYITL